MTRQRSRKSYLQDKDREKYIRNKGIKCPYCGSTELEGGFIQIDGPEAWQDITCLNCERKWQDVYVLCRIEDFLSPE